MVPFRVRAEVAKTRTRRTLPISPTTAKATSKLLSVRHPEWENAVPVFCSQDDLKEQHAHASPVNKLIPVRLRVGKIR